MATPRSRRVSAPPHMNRRLLLRALTAMGMLLPSRAYAQAGLRSNVPTIPLSAVKPSSLTVAVTSGSTLAIASLIDNAVNTFPAPVRIATTWDLQTATQVRLVAYFTAPAQALANGTSLIPTSRVNGRVLTAPVQPRQPVTWTAFTQNGTRGIGQAGGSLRLFYFAITPANRKSAWTIDLELQLDLVGLAPLTPGTYAGTLNLRAVTI